MVRYDQLRKVGTEIPRSLERSNSALTVTTQSGVQQHSLTEVASQTLRVDIIAKEKAVEYRNTAVRWIRYTTAQCRIATIHLGGARDGKVENGKP